jgi:hypothetical protein
MKHFKNMDEAKGVETKYVLYLHEVHKMKILFLKIPTDVVEIRY